MNIRKSHSSTESDFFFFDREFLEYCTEKDSEATSVLEIGNILQSGNYCLPWTRDGVRQHTCQAITSLIVIIQ